MIIGRRVTPLILHHEIDLLPPPKEEIAMERAAKATRFPIFRGVHMSTIYLFIYVSSLGIYSI